MGIETATYKVLQGLRGRVSSILCLGYPDLLVDPAEIRGTYTERDDADKIRQWHRWSGPVYDTEEVLRDELGLLEIEFADVVAHRGPERLVDLNQYVEWGRTYDVVLDGGTAEHCFNIGQVFDNIHRAVGKFVIHVNPLNMINHGFWNVSPTAYHDFYDQNGYIIMSAGVMYGHPDTRYYDNLNEKAMVGRFQPHKVVEMTNLFVAEKVRGDTGPAVWPVQHKYKGMIHE